MIWDLFEGCVAQEPLRQDLSVIPPVLLCLFPPCSRVVINSPSRVLLLQFEAVVWDYSLPADREVGKKDKKAQKGKRQGAGAEQQQAQDTSSKPRQPPKSHGGPKSITLSPCFPGFSKLSYKPSSLQPSQYSPCSCQEQMCCSISMVLSFSRLL